MKQNKQIILCVDINLVTE